MTSEPGVTCAGPEREALLFLAAGTLPDAEREAALAHLGRCPRCQEEEKPFLLVTIDIPGDDREVHGLCWTHRLRILGKPPETDQGGEPEKR